MADQPDVFIEYTFTSKTPDQVHRAVAKVRGAKIAEFRIREKDQESLSFDLAHSLSEDFVKFAMAYVLPDARYALSHALLTSEPPSIESHQPIGENDTVTVWVISGVSRLD